MLKIIPDRWSTPNWCKPFGFASERREQAIVGNIKADLIPFAFVDETIKLSPKVRAFKRRSKVCLLGRANYTHKRRSVVRVKSFAHDRLVMSAYLEAPRHCGRTVSNANLRRGMPSPSTLELPRETRRGVKIGNRWRNIPLTTKFTTNARNWVRDVAHICEHAQKGTGQFATLTLPGGTADAFRIMSIASGYIVDRLNRWLRYKVSGSIYCYVWELQKRGAPHLHYVYRLPEGVNPSFFNFLLRQQWIKILWEVSEQTGVDLFARRDGGTHRNDRRHVQVCSKLLTGTYARYISKYMTKEMTKAGTKNKWCPGRWWGVSYEGRKAACRLRLDSLIEVDDDEMAVSSLRLLAEFLSPLAVAQHWFSRCPNGQMDSVSIQCGAGSARLLHLCLRAVFLHGDYEPLRRFVTGNTALVQRAQTERKELHEHSERKLRANRNARTEGAARPRFARDDRSKAVAI